MSYEQFLERKLKTSILAGFKAKQISNVLFDFQKHIVTKALESGRYAIFSECGTGKTLMQNGFIYHSRVTIWKDPVTEMTRTKAIGLLNKQKDKDATLSRVGIPDYLLIFRKQGENPVPVKHTSTDQRDPNYIPIPLWQKYASPVWMDIDYGKTLNKEGRESDDEKHIAPLQLETIERAIHLWTNPGETVFTPFLGIGSEVFQALKMGRRGIGIELKESYFKIAQKNCKNATIAKSQLSFV